VTVDVREAKSTAPRREGFAGYSRAENDRLVGLRPDSKYHHRDIGGDGGRVPRDQMALMDGLLRPKVCPWRPPVVELVETHVSWVFLTGDRVVKARRLETPLKLKKPPLAARGSEG